MYTPEELERYKKNVNGKIMFHRQHGTKLLYTFSEYNDKRPLIDHLKDILENTNKIKYYLNKNIII